MLLCLYSSSPWTMLLLLLVSTNSNLLVPFVEIQCKLQNSNQILSKQIQTVRVVQSLDSEPPTVWIAPSIRVVLFISIWMWNPPYTELLQRLTFNLVLKHWISTTLLLWKPNGDNWNSSKALWLCQFEEQSKQWRTVGLTVLQKTSIIQQLSVELTSCPSS